MKERVHSAAAKAAQGRLLLVPAPLDLGCALEPLTRAVPDEVLAQMAHIDHWIVEDAKSARAYLKRVSEHYPLNTPVQSHWMGVLPRPGHKSDQASRPEDLLEPLQRGKDIGLLSEAGLPAVADPGSLVVALAHRWGATVVPLVGASSLMLALAASGLQGQSFAFVGYVPQEAAARTQRLLALQQRSLREGQTQILIETPYRNAALMQALLDTLSPSTRVAVAYGLTLTAGWTKTLAVGQWREQPPAFDRSIPAVFSFLA